MKTRIIGRALGIGIRVAGRVAGQRVAENARASAASAAPVQNPAQVARTAQAPSPAEFRAKGQAAGQIAAKSAKNAGRGVAGFLRPFQRVGGILWLEVTGAFFLVFAVALAPALWRTRLSYAQGPDHRTFWAAAVIMVVFVYLGVSSFWRARKR
jgi:hypothetical protein